MNIHSTKKLQINNNNLRYWLTAANFQSRQHKLMTYTRLFVVIVLNAHLQHRLSIIRFDFRIVFADTMVRRELMTTIRVNVSLADILASIDLKVLLIYTNSAPSECWLYVSSQSARTDCYAMR